MEKKFTVWYADHVKGELDKGKKIEEIDTSMEFLILNHCMWNG